MQKNKIPEMKYRKDYIPPTHLIDKVDLTVELGEEVTTVVSQLQVRQNPQSKEKSKQLVLDGKDQELKSVKLNGEIILSKQYKLDAEHLTIFDLPEAFTLEIQSEIKPQENTSLMGLYKSNNMYCTQCESEGFRKITYYLDRPDVLSSFTTTILADKKQYPLLLSNGNLVEYGDMSDGLHWIKWEDPFKKPSYLFAMVAGDLDFIEDYFTTMSGRNITIRIFSEKGNQEKCGFAMSSVKKAMKWDEENYGREYDLDLFMILAVGDFNMGAMENKGLNVFNSKYVFADPKTATDNDYLHIDDVVAHEYFHNWSGDRVTCRDWFQLSLKEGFTVFREQSFAEDIGSKAISRIDQVQCLRTAQFPEDAGPLAHSVRPDSYMEINNFYTTTIYEKGAEVIRMLKIIVGDEKYRRATDLYFKRFDGQAVTCDDFVECMEETSGIDLSQFKLWYSQAGTPELKITAEYNAQQQTYGLTVKQVIPPTPGQSHKLPMFMPLAVALLDEDGKEIKDTAQVLYVKEPQETFVFKDIAKKPIPSLLRGFSAPVKLTYNYTDEELTFLMTHDADEFARWEAGQKYAIKVIFALMDDFKNGKELKVTNKFVEVYRQILLDEKADKALIARLLTLPAEIYLAELMDVIDVDAIHAVREFLRQQLANALEKEFSAVYQKNCSDREYRFTIDEVARRSLKNICLAYLAQVNKNYQLALKQFEDSTNMTDQQAALTILSNLDCPARAVVLQKFYAQWQNEPLVVNKWFLVQALSSLPNTLDNVINLVQHPAFNMKNPNKVYSLIGAFANSNQVRFHDISGKGYQFLADHVLRLDKFNAMLSGRIVDAFANWRRFDETRRELMQKQLQRILAEPKLSKDLYEKVSKCLESV
jgi:aminopeptidase N